MRLSPFKRKPTLDHANPEVRRKALAELPDTDQDRLVRVVREDPDPKLRKAAIDRVTALDPLLSLADAGIETAAVLERITRIAPEDHALAKDPRVVAVRLRTVSSANEFMSAAGCLEDPAQLATAILSASSLELRDTIFDAIFDPELLTEIEKASRRKDKTLHRRARDRLNEFRELQKRLSNSVRTADDLLAAALECQLVDKNYESKRDALEAKWDAARSEIRELESALERFGIKSSALSEREDLFPERHEIEQVLEGPNLFAPVFKALEACGDDEDQLRDVESLWLQVTMKEQAPTNVAERFYRESSAIRVRIDNQRRLAERVGEAAPLLEPVEWNAPTDKLETWAKAWSAHKTASTRLHEIEKFLKPTIDGEDGSSLVGELEEMSRRCTEILENCDDLKRRTYDRINSGLDDLDEMLAAGESTRANSKSASIQDLIRRLPQTEQRRPSGNLARRYPRIRELNTWKSFAEAPKRVELCERMETLAEEAHPAVEQLGRIKALRSDWIQLGRPKSSEEHELMERFDAAAEKAFEPCSEQFQQERDMRAKNLEARRRICDQLEEYADSVDWDSPDLRSLAQILRAARQEWREAGPVERSQSRQVGKRWYTVTKRMQNRLNDEYRASEEKKRAIIEEARAAYEDQALDNDELVDRIKQLQADWKQIGPARRNAEQRLWIEFREICDQVFEDRSNRYYQRKAEVDDEVARAHRRVSEVSDAVNSSIENGETPDLELVRQARVEIDGMPLPERTRSRLQKELSSIARTARESIASAETEAWTHRFKRALEIEGQLADLEESEDGVPADWLQSAGSHAEWFEQRALGDADNLRRLTVRAEMLAGVDSPAEDAQQRVALQVENLQRKIRGSRITGSDAVEEIVRDWTGSAFGATPYRERFVTAIHGALARISREERGR